MYKVKYIFFKNLLHFCDPVILNIDTTTVITGSNGSGKTCMMNIINDILVLENKNEISKKYSQTKSSHNESFFGVLYEMDDRQYNELKLFATCKYLSAQTDKCFGDIIIHKTENKEENIKKISNCIDNFPFDKYIVDIHTFNNSTQNMNRYVLSKIKKNKSLRKSIEIFINRIGNSPCKFLVTHQFCFNGDGSVGSGSFSEVKINRDHSLIFNNINDFNHISIKNLVTSDFEDLFKYINKFLKIGTIYLSQDRGLFNSLPDINSKKYCVEDMQNDLVYIQKFRPFYDRICNYVEKHYNINIFLQSSKNNLTVNFKEKYNQYKELRFNQVPGSLVNALFMIVPILKSIADGGNFAFLCDEIEQNMDNYNMKILFDELSDLFSQYHCKNMIIVTHNKKFMETVINYANIKYIDTNKNLCGKVTDINDSLADIELNNKATKLSELLDLLLSRDKKKICVEGITDMIFIDYFLKEKCKVSCGIFNFKGFGNMEKLIADCLKILARESI